MNKEFEKFLKLVSENPEEALFQAAKSVIGNAVVDSPVQLKSDEKYKAWAGPHGTYNLRIAIEACLKKRGKK